MQFIPMSVSDWGKILRYDYLRAEGLGMYAHPLVGKNVIFVK